MKAPPTVVWTFLILQTEAVDVNWNLYQPRDSIDSNSDVDYVEWRRSKMKFEDIKFVDTDMPKGSQALMKFGDKYELSIIQNESSYGNAKGLYEIAVFHNGGLYELPGITEPGDTVKGFLTKENVLGIVKKMHLITGCDPIQA